MTLSATPIHIPQGVIPNHASKASFVQPKVAAVISQPSPGNQAAQVVDATARFYKNTDPVLSISLTGVALWSVIVTIGMLRSHRHR